MLTVLSTWLSLSQGPDPVVSNSSTENGAMLLIAYASLPKVCDVSCSQLQ